MVPSIRYMRAALLVAFALLVHDADAQIKANLSSGFVDFSGSIVLSHSTNHDVYYTLDGSRPTIDALLYQGPIYLNAVHLKNRISDIPTNPSFDYPKGGYTELRANNRGWLPPYSDATHGVVIRAQMFKDGHAIGAEFNGVYLPQEVQPSFPVVSLVVDPGDFFSDERGIYVFGAGNTANYEQSGREWERDGLLTYFDSKGDQKWKQQMGLRIHGGGGRHSAQKNIRCYARSSLGDQVLEYPVFEDLPYDEFKRFIIRSGGHRPDCFPRDDLSHLIMQDVGLDVQAGKWVVMYINGEYWGMHTLKERQDQFYIKYKYLMDDGEVTIFDNEGDIEEGVQSDSTLFNEIEEFVELAAMDSSDVAYLAQHIDIDNFLTYQASQIILGNGDWPNGNVKMWRKHSTGYDPYAPAGHDGRFRWFMYDLDGGYGGSCNGTYVTMNGIDRAMSVEDGISGYTILLRGMMKNEKLKHKFLNRILTLVNTTFSNEQTLPMVDSVFEALESGMLSHVTRWRYPSIDTTLIGRSKEVPSLLAWHQIEEDLRFFLTHRPDYVRQHVVNYLGGGANVSLDLKVANSQQGRLKINDYLSVVDSVRATYVSGLPVQVEAIPAKGFVFSHWSDTAEGAVRWIDPAGTEAITAFFQPDTGEFVQIHPHINEFLASNEQQSHDAKKEYDDWIELYNPFDQPIDLSGYFITDEAGKFKTQIPIESGLKIPPHGFRVFWADDEEDEGIYHLGFKLSKEGEAIYLFAPDSTLVDSVVYSDQTTDVSWGRENDTSDQWKSFVYPTRGYSNTLTSVAEGELPDQRWWVYPTMASHKVFLPSRADVWVFSIDGQLFNHVEAATSIEVSQWPAGFYVLKSDQGIARISVVH